MVNILKYKMKFNHIISV